MRTVDEAIQAIQDHFDEIVRELGQEDYREVLERVLSDMQSRLDCVIEEMQAEGVD